LAKEVNNLLSTVKITPFVGAKLTLANDGYDVFERLVLLHD
jgi:hypothetical protein